MELKDRFRPRLERLEDRTAPASGLPANFVESTIGTGFSDATAMEIATNGDVWVLEQGGRVLRFRAGVTTADVVANLANLGLDPGGERGLLGIAFNPDYASNKHVFFYYTTDDFATRRNRISRFTVNDSDATDYYLEGSNTAPTDAGSTGSPTETILMDLDNLSSATNHNGGAIHFGANGLLYVAVGDNANGANAQVVTNLHGKMLRMDASNFDGTFNSLVPTGANANPTSFRVWNGSAFETVTPTGEERLIYAVGLRNPFTFGFRQGTNEFYINDVGQNTWEEINVGGAGRNYGWSQTEGNFNQATWPDFTRPFFAYHHSNGTPSGNVITGGAFYNPATSMFPGGYTGDYFFADVGAGWIYRIDTSNGSVTHFANNAGAVDLRIASDGSLIYTSRWDNQLHRIIYNANTAPSISQHPTNQAVTAGNNATFTVVASGTPAPTYQWQRADSATPNTWANIGGATSASYTVTGAQAADHGDHFRVVVTNSEGNATSNAATLTVNQMPIITDQPDSTTVNPGQTASFSVVAGGTAPFTYQWQRFVSGAWTNVGSNASSFSLTAQQSDSGAQFRVIVSNAAGNVTSDTATLTVTQAAVIGTQPASITVNPGQTAAFSVAATGTNPLSYQWQRFVSGAWTNVGSDADSYSFTAAAGDTGAQFRVRITNVAGTTTSSTATLTVRQPAAIDTPPGNQSVNEGANATFSVTATGTAPLTYQWQRFVGGSWTDVGTNASSFSLTAAAADHNAQFRVIVSNAVNSVTSNAATLTVNRRPTAGITITGGLSNGNFIAGQAITFTGSGSDPEDGTVSNLTWQVQYVSSLNTNPVVRPFVPATTGGNGSFTPATTGPYNLTDVLYRITVTATDAGGLSHVATLDIDPEIWTFTIHTTPAGLQLAVDAIPTDTPTAIDSIVGFERPLAALPHFGHVFQQWSDGVASADRIVTGLSGPTTFTAEYLEVFHARVNFQDGTSEGFPDYLADTGAVFGDRGNGFSYGWNLDNSAAALNRNAGRSPDERYDTLQLMPAGQVWEIAVPNGVYQVRIVAGDPKAFNSDFRIKAEGMKGVFGTPTKAKRWLEKTVTVTVLDGMLTIHNGGAAKNSKINFVDILRVADVTDAFLQSTGKNRIVSMEAEHFHASTSQGGMSWEAFTARTGFSGTSAMIALPNNGLTINTGYAAASPRLDYQIYFNHAGTHYVWLRGLGQTGNDNTVHVGLDGVELTSADRIGNFANRYGWVGGTLDGARARIDVATPGLHTLNLWMREDGVVVDRILLTKKARYRPQGIGPAESQRHVDAGLVLAAKPAIVAAPVAAERAAPSAVIGKPEQRNAWSEWLTPDHHPTHPSPYPWHNPDWQTVSAVFASQSAWTSASPFR